MTRPSQFDHYVMDEGPAALVLREYLMAVEGTDAVLFPATFAAGSGFAGGYNINEIAGDKDGRNVCLIDSVGSQANRIEPLFMRETYRDLVPQIVVKAGEKEVNLLEAGHRAGDALFRCSSLQDELQKAFRSELRGDCEPLARIAPTSLVFGVWDSRDTQSKRPRIVSSTIRAFNVRRLTRGAVYVPPLDYAALEVFSDEDRAKAEGNNKSPLAQRGFVHNPASGSDGGVIADGGIRRDATLGLAALRHLYSGTNHEKTLDLRRYILGLSLVAFTAPTQSYLRQGCTLVLNPEPGSGNSAREFCEVYPNGQRKPCDLTHEAALEFARSAAQAFKVGESRSVSFEKERAKRDVKDDEGNKGKAKRGSKKGEPSAEIPGDNG